MKLAAGQGLPPALHRRDREGAYFPEGPKIFDRVGHDEAARPRLLSEVLIETVELCGGEAHLSVVRDGLRTVARSSDGD